MCNSWMTIEKCDLSRGVVFGTAFTDKLTQMGRNWPDSSPNNEVPTFTHERVMETVKWIVITQLNVGLEQARGR